MYKKTLYIENRSYLALVVSKQEISEIVMMFIQPFRDNFFSFIGRKQ